MKASKQAVLDELDWVPEVSAVHIGVTARDGVVTLTGHVGSYSEKISAGKAAAQPQATNGAVKHNDENIVDADFTDVDQQKKGKKSA